MQPGAGVGRVHWGVGVKGRCLTGEQGGLRGGGRAREHGDTGRAGGYHGEWAGAVIFCYAAIVSSGGRPFSVFLGRYPPC